MKYMKKAILGLDLFGKLDCLKAESSCRWWKDACRKKCNLEAVAGSYKQTDQLEAVQETGVGDLIEKYYLYRCLGFFFFLFKVRKHIKWVE